MKKLLFVALWGLCAAPHSAATVEFGGQFSVLNYYRSDDPDKDDMLAVAIPGTRNLYLLWFPSQRWSVGPYLSFYSSWLDKFSGWNAYPGLLARYYPHPYTNRGLYYEGQVGALVFDGEYEETVVGSGLGYQWPREGQFVWTISGYYGRWVTAETNRFSFIVTLGKR